MPETKLSYEAWVKEFEAELLKRTRLTWADACGDLEVLLGYYESGETPSAQVTWYIEKYNLDDYSQNEWGL